MSVTLINSIDKKTIYFLVQNPFMQIGKMQSKNTCKGCTYYDEACWDKLEKRYNHYCWLFDVWQDSSKPNEICQYNMRNNEKIKQLINEAVGN